MISYVAQCMSMILRITLLYLNRVLTNAELCNYKNNQWFEIMQ